MTRERPRTAAEYTDQLTALLPEGPVWQGFRDFDGRGRKLLEIRAEGLAETDARVFALIRESHPETVLEMLAAREREAGLPDPCTGMPETLQGRRDQLVARWRARGGLSPHHFKRLAADVGYEVEIEEFRPARADYSTADDPCCDEEWWFTFRVRGPSLTFREARADQSYADEPLRSWGNDPLKCAINGREPAGAVVLFAFDIEE